MLRQRNLFCKATVARIARRNLRFISPLEFISLLTVCTVTVTPHPRSPPYPVRCLCKILWPKIVGLTCCIVRRKSARPPAPDFIEKRLESPWAI